MAWNTYGQGHSNSCQDKFIFQQKTDLLQPEWPGGFTLHFVKLDLQALLARPRHGSVENDRADSGKKPEGYTDSEQGTETVYLKQMQVIDS